MPDLVKAIKGRRKNLTKIWSGKEWKEHKAPFLKDHPWCEMHLELGVKVPATIPHHPYRNSYKGHYTDLELSQCVAYCSKCHFSLHKGRKLCPVCKIRYPRWDQEMCWDCFCAKNPEVLEKIVQKNEQNKAKQKQLRSDQNKKNRELRRKLKNHANI